MTSAMKSATHGTTRFHYDSGLVGLVVIEVSEDSIGGSDDESIMEVEVPGEDIMALVLDQLRNELIRRLENAEGEELKALLLGMVDNQHETEDEPGSGFTEIEIGHHRMLAPKGFVCPACKHSSAVHREAGCDVRDCDCEVPYGRLTPGD